ncbi:hypothetical protein cypCar_00028526 [Cyprinus carpio]|nr:hypothetical protein cypCar_00028526 [Cyprinus carpio]
MDCFIRYLSFQLEEVNGSPAQMIAGEPVMSLPGLEPQGMEKPQAPGQAWKAGREGDRSWTAWGAPSMDAQPWFHRS